MRALRRPILASICLLFLCAGRAQHPPGSESSRGLPFPPSTPAALKAVWLDFHATRLCQEIDAVFVFHSSGLEVWCAAQSTKSIDRLKRMTEPLAPHYRVDLYVTHQQPERDEEEESGAPPGLWNNQELRSYLGTFGAEAAAPAGKFLTGFDDTLLSLEHRVQMFADQTLELSQRLRRFAADLQDLSTVGFDPSYGADDNARARTLCMTHAAGVDECASKLDQNLRRAFPDPARRTKPQAKGRASFSSASAPEIAARIAREAETVAQRVYRFIYPDQFTVGIADLRDPGLLESLAALRRMAAAYQQKLKKS
jgi:hypothetical protein